MDKSDFTVRWDITPLTQNRIQKEKDKERYVSFFKTELGYHSVSGFLNELAALLIDKKAVILRFETPLMKEKLESIVRERHYDGIEDWIKEQIRKELNA